MSDKKTSANNGRGRTRNFACVVYPESAPVEWLDILKEQFTGDFTYSGVTGNDISWEDNGYVAKEAVKYTLKTANYAKYLNDTIGMMGFQNRLRNQLTGVSFEPF